MFSFGSSAPFKPVFGITVTKPAGEEDSESDEAAAAASSAARVHQNDARG
jgi:hypothetical protein